MPDSTPTPELCAACELPIELEDDAVWIPSEEFDIENAYHERCAPKEEDV